MSSIATSARQKLAARFPSGYSVAVGGLAAAVLITILYALGTMVATSVSQVGSGRWTEIASAPWFAGMVTDTLIVVGVSSVVAVAIACILAWINERSDAGLGPIGGLLPVVPLFLSTVAMAVGWVVLATPGIGFLNGVLDWLLSPLGVSFEFNIYSYPGLIFLYVLHLVPYAYLPIVAAFRNLDSSLEEAARLSGAKPLKVIRTVSLPAIGPAIFAGLILVTVVAFSLFSVPMIVGTRPQIDIVAVRIVRLVRNSYPPEYETAVLLSTFLLIFLASLWFVQGVLLRSGRFSKVGGRSAGVTKTRLGRTRWLFRSLLIGYALVAVVLPVLALLTVSFQTYWQPNIFASDWTLTHLKGIIFGYPQAVAGIQNSLVLGLVGGAFTVLIAALLVMYAKRKSGGIGRLADSVAKVPGALPKAVLGVAFIYAFAGAPFHLGATIAIVAIAYFIAFLPYASIASEASVAQLDSSVEEASRISGATEGVTLRKVVLPLISPGLFAAWALVFVRVFNDLELAALLGTGRTPLSGFVLLDIFGQGNLSELAALSLILTAIALPVVLIMMWLGQPRWRRRATD